MTPQQEKQLAIAESILHTTGSVVRAIKSYPKKNKYFFTRDDSRGRSRRDKVNRRKSTFDMLVSAMTGAAQIAMIVSQPIPKFENGSI